MLAAKDRIIVALDVPTLDEARRLIERLQPHVTYFKVGLELITACGAPAVVDAVKQSGARIFFDGKFNDIPNTIGQASRRVTELGVDMFNIHACSGNAAIKAAAAEKKNACLLAVTVLTSFDEEGCYQVFGNSSSEKVREFALMAKHGGADGIVCSPQELSMLAKVAELENFVRVTPGVRPEWAAANDQKRVLTPADALRLGATYLVIGRPITQPPREIGDAAEAAKRIVDEMEGALR